MYEDEVPLGRAENLAGKKFGRWTVLYRVKDRGKSSYWKCRCDCGTEREVCKKHLKSGRSQSCGCLHKEIVTNYHLLDITGQRFGNLVAIKPTNKKLGTSIIWECQCDCGNTCYVSVSHLKQGNNKSCGCLISKGEEQVRQLLNNHNINFTAQKTFENCRLPSGRMAKFDFYINDSYLLEYDGIQHFETIEFFGGDDQLLTQQERDAYKNQWCKDNNIPLIRIPYTKLDTLCFEDLMLETTQFRVV